MAEDKPATPAYPADYVVPEVWKLDEEPSATGNRPTAGPRFESTLPKGEHPYQLYSLGTPNGVKATILFEELNDLKGTEYDSWRVDLFQRGEQFGSGFVDVNPNSKIPALLDMTMDPPLRIFESGSILKYVAEKEGAFIPKDPRASVECINWLFWQIGTTPLLAAAGQFMRAPVKLKYAIDRFSMEAKRQFDVLDQHLAKNRFLAGDEYSIADMAVWPWIHGMQVFHDSAKFLGMEEYTHMQRWVEEIKARPAVQRGIRVNGFFFAKGDDAVANRHSRADFDKKEE